MIRDAARLLVRLRVLHAMIRDAVVTRTEREAVEMLAAVVAEERGGDTLFALDRVSEERLVAFFEREVAPEWPLVLIAEGLPDSGSGEGRLVLPRGSAARDAEIRVLMDPIDGTRGLMYQKRSAWVLTGVAPNHGRQTRLSDIELALQTEIPLVKQHLSDVLWATRGAGLSARRYNRLTGEEQPLTLHPSAAPALAQGFVTLCRFFPSTGVELAALEDELMRAALGPARPGQAQAFEDQYICTGGQLYELIAGHDRFIADLRPLAQPRLARRGAATGLCCHPYDLATALLAEEAGVSLTDARGQRLDAPLDVTSQVAWVGYANAALREQIEPLLLAALARHGLE